MDSNAYIDKFPKSSLVEPRVLFMMNQSLKQYHNNKIKYYNWIFNIILFLAFILILGLILLYKYKGKLTPIEINKNKKEKEQYILSKIKNFQESKRIAQQELITGLPHWKSDHDMISSTHLY
jgi:hypothetical protein